MRKIIFLIPVLIIVLAGKMSEGIAQSVMDKTDLELARSLKAKHPKDDFYATTSEIKYSFELSKDKNDKTPVKVNELKSENIIRIKAGFNVTYTNVTGYNNTSEIKEFKLFDKKGVLKPYEAVTQHRTHESGGIFHSDARIFVYSMKFDDQGRIYKYTLSKRYNDIKYLTSVYFHEHYPIKEKIISFEVPEWLELDFIEKNLQGFALQKKVTDDPKKKIKTYTFTLKELQGERSETNAPGPSYALPHILVIAKSYTEKDGTRKNIFSTNKDLYGWYAGLVSEIGNETSKLKPLVEKLIANAKTDVEKIEALYYWVQDNIRYVAFEEGIAGFKPEKCQKVLEYKFGDCKGMANLLKEMLIIAGFDARLTWLGTRFIAYDYSIPSIAVDNHMICTVNMNGTWHFLDPTETFIAFGDIAHRIQGRQAMVENGSSFELATIPEFSKERNKVEIIRKMEIKDDLLTGKCNEVYNGEGKTNILRSYSTTKTDKKSEAVKSFLNGRNKNVSIKNINYSDLEERKGPAGFDYDFSARNQIFDINNEKYITIDFDNEFKYADFDSARTKDYVYGYKYMLIKKIDLKIPAGYKVEHLPAGMNRSTPDYTFKVSFKQTGNIISYYKEISIDNALIKKEDFPEWNKSVQELRKIYEDQIILIR